MVLVSTSLPQLVPIQIQSDRNAHHRAHRARQAWDEMIPIDSSILAMRAQGARREDIAHYDRRGGTALTPVQIDLTRARLVG